MFVNKGRSLLQAKRLKNKTTLYLPFSKNRNPTSPSGGGECGGGGGAGNLLYLR